MVQKINTLEEAIEMIGELENTTSRQSVEIRQLSQQNTTLRELAENLMREARRAVDWAKHAYRVDHNGFIWVYDVDAKEYHRTEMRVHTPEVPDGSITTEKLDDKAVTNEKMDEGAVDWKNLSGDVQNIIASREEGGVALSNDWGDSELIGITQKKLTEEHDGVNAQIEILVTEINTEAEERRTNDDALRERIEGAENAISEEKERAEGVEEAHGERLDSLENTVGSGGDVDTRIATAVAAETQRAMDVEATKADKSDTYTKDEVNSLITTPDQQYVSVATYAELPATGAANTIYRVANWDGKQSRVDNTKYTEYAWSGNSYVLLSVKESVGEALVGYFTCSTAAATDAKAVTAAGYTIPTSGGAIKIKMTNANTAANATLNINDTGAKPLFYDGEPVSAANTWGAGEVISVYYDGTNYQATNVLGGGGGGIKDIPVTAGRWINLSGENIGAVGTDASWQYALYPCSEGDVVLISGTGGQSPRLWAFADANNVILSRADAAVTEENLILVAPANAAWIAINNNNATYPNPVWKIAKAGKDGAVVLKNMGYINRDVPKLAVGKTYEVDDCVLYDGQRRRIIKEVGTMNLTDSVAVGDLKVYSNATYQAQKAVGAYSSATTYEDGGYAVGSPSGGTIRVTVDSEAIAQLTEPTTIAVTICGVEVSVSVDSESDSQTIARAIYFNALGTLDDWEIRYGGGNNIYLASKVGKNTAPTLTSSTGDTGVTVAFVDGTIYTGSLNVSVYDVDNGWTAITAAQYIAVEGMWEQRTVEWLAGNITEIDSVKKDLDNVKDYLLSYKKTEILNVTKAKSGDYAETLHGMEIGKTYLISARLSVAATTSICLYKDTSHSKYLQLGVIRDSSLTVLYTFIDNYYPYIGVWSKTTNLDVTFNIEEVGGITPNDITRAVSDIADIKGSEMAITLNWEQGNITPDTGVDISATTVIRTPEPRSCAVMQGFYDRIITTNPMSITYDFQARFYKDSTYLGALACNNADMPIPETLKDFNYVRFIIWDRSSQSITPSSQVASEVSVTLRHTGELDNENTNLRVNQPLALTAPAYSNIIDVPKVYIMCNSLAISGYQITINGVRLTTSKNEVGDTGTDAVQIRFESNTVNFTDNITIAYQGNSTLRYDKKGFAIDLADKHRFGRWREFDSFHLKGYHTDWMHCRDAAANWILEQMFTHRESGNIRPWMRYNDFGDSAFAKNADGGMLAHTDQFPVELYFMDKAEGSTPIYWGLYSVVLKKDADNYGISKYNGNHIMLDSDAFYCKQTMDWAHAEIRFPKGLSKNQKYLLTSTGVKYDGDNPTELLGSDNVAVYDPDNELHVFCNTLKQKIVAWNTFNYATLANATKEQIEKHWNIEEYIDHLLFCGFTGDGDKWQKNTLYTTWDGQHFAPIIYDEDQAFGVCWPGYNKFNSAQSYNHGTGTFPGFTHLEYLYADDIKNRYHYLRDSGVFSVENVINLIKHYVQWVGQDAYEKDMKRWTYSTYGAGAIDGSDTVVFYQSLDNLSDYMKRRIAYLDGLYGYSE